MAQSLSFHATWKQTSEPATASWRPETPGSEVKDSFFIHGESSSQAVSICVASPRSGFHRAVGRGLGWYLYPQRVMLHESGREMREPKARREDSMTALCPGEREIISIVLDRKHIYSFALEVDAISTFQGCLEPGHCLCSQDCAERNSRDPWRIVSQHQTDTARLRSPGRSLSVVICCQFCWFAKGFWYETMGVLVLIILCKQEPDRPHSPPSSIYLYSNETHVFFDDTLP